jgi:hypothetical protein
MIESAHSEAAGKPGMISVFGNRLTAMNTTIFFLLIFAYHLIVIFQGLDFNDEGFHLAFYQQIFKDPESVQYAFWGWLSGMVGGGFMKIFPFLGIWGIRLLGAIVSTATIIIAYNLIKNYVHNGYLKVSMIMLSLFINEDAKNLYYNNLSAFLYFVSVYFLFSGLCDKKKWMVFTAGFFVGLNIFTRLPNLLGISMILVIFYYGCLTRITLSKLVIRSVIFLSGTIFAFLLVFGVMESFNHLTYFSGSLKMLFSSNNHAALDDGLNGAYGIGRLLNRNLIEYAKSLRFILFIGILVCVIVYVQYLIQYSSNAIRTGYRVFLYTLALAVFALPFIGWFTSYRLIEFFTGMSLLSAIVLFDKEISKEYKLLAFFGLLILLIHPFGSSEGILTVVVYSMWISFPISMDYIVRLNRITMHWQPAISSRFGSLKSILHADLFRRIIWVLICLVSVACIYNVIRYPYLCDRHLRVEMRYSVDNKFMKGVFTSKGRVDALNELLAASSGFVKPNDYVLAYDCMPLYHFMTETKSYVRNPCIWFYTTGLFREELKLAELRRTQLPVIVRQLIKTTGEGSAWPETRPEENYLAFKRTQGKNRILDEFISRHHYKEVWKNGEFEILVPRNE